MVQRQIKQEQDRFIQEAHIRKNHRTSHAGIRIRKSKQDCSERLPGGWRDWPIHSEINQQFELQTQVRLLGMAAQKLERLVDQVGRTTLWQERQGSDQEGKHGSWKQIGFLRVKTTENRMKRNQLVR